MKLLYFSWRAPWGYFGLQEIQDGDSHRIAGKNMAQTQPLCRLLTVPHMVLSDVGFSSNIDGN
jgi:hypothetical protein